MQDEEDRIAYREKLLSEISKDKSLIALALEEVREVDRQLSSGWGIKYCPSGSELCDLLDQLEDQDAVELFWDVHNGAADEFLGGRPANSGGKADAAVYDAIAHPELLGPVTSQRRHFIIDAIAVSIGLNRYLGLEGRMLDVGCHAGTLTHILSEKLQRPAVGIDPSRVAIEFARRHNRPLSTAEFVCGKMPWEAADRFDMIVAIDSMPVAGDAVGPFFEGIADLLQPGGIGIVSSPFWMKSGKKTRKQLDSANLAFGYADVVGGLGGIPPEFDATELLVLIKGGHVKLPVGNLRQLAESEWHYFRHYANASQTRESEKTQAFERALRSRGRVQANGIR